ncbi:MAG TPA: sigma-70 family RNA polymerase sigma factor [Acidimicrobiales bacterium]|nr:sigma-70 family RNA polymerase sigma factor [Acidimicrobiales bacterium]
MTRRDRFDGQFDHVLTAAHTGAPWAYERIFTALAPVVEGYLRTQGAAEPEDVTSEVFLAVFRNLGTFAGDEAGFRSWVFTIAHRRLMDARRAAGRRPRPEPLLEADLRPAPDDVEGTVEQRLADEQVQDLCNRLLPGQRDVLLMRILGRLTVDEVAVALGKSPGAVKALQRRGLQAIARMIEREGVPL